MPEPPEWVLCQALDLGGWQDRGCAASTMPPATDMHPSSCLATGLGFGIPPRSLSDWEAAADSARALELPLSFCLGAIHFLLVTALLFSILSSGAFLISCKFLYNHTLPPKHEIITDNFSSCAGYCRLNVEVKS